MENFARTTRKARLALPFRALTALDQEQESGSARGEAGGGGKIGAKRNGDNAGQDAIRIWHGRTGHFADRRARSAC